MALRVTRDAERQAHDASVAGEPGSLIRPGCGGIFSNQIFVCHAIGMLAAGTGAGIAPQAHRQGPEFLNLPAGGAFSRGDIRNGPSSNARIVRSTDIGSTGADTCPVENTAIWSLVSPR